jgi:arylformamidase
VAGPWLDITLPIAPDACAWAGLAGPRLSFLTRIDGGAAVNVGQIDCCLHTGTHADAPFHVLAAGATAERLDVSAYLGPALVVRTADPSAITVAELRAAGVERLRPERLLVATPAQYDGVHFPARVPHLAADAAELLVALGVRLVGVNVPSLDPLDSKTLDAHKLLFAGGIAVLENLALTGVRPGPYELVAQPLSVVGGDAAPVRALLRRGP